MTRTEKDRFIKWARQLSGEELERQYYDIAFACLGSEAEEMYERGYDIVDIMEQEKYERDLGVRAGILEGVCAERGIPLWKDGDTNG